MSMTTIACSHCGQTYNLAPQQVPQYSGQTITCTACKQPFTVPVLAGGPPAMPTPVAQYATPGSFSQVPPKSNGPAVASLVLGIGGFCVPVLSSIPAIILGVIGLRKAREPNVGGRGLAIAGLILGCVSMVLMVVPMLMIAITLPALSSAREQANRVQCAANLRTIGQAAMLYSNDWRGQLPPNLEVLARQYDLSLSGLVCASCDDTAATDVGSIGQGNVSYVYCAKKGWSISRSPETVLAHDKLANHHGEGMNVLFLDGSVQWYGAPQAKALLAELEKGNNPPKSQ